MQKLLEKVAMGGVHSYADLCRELGVSESLLEQMLTDLERVGYLKRVGMGCDEHCADCQLGSACAVGGAGKVWTLTEKGSRRTQEAESKGQQLH